MWNEGCESVSMHELELAWVFESASLEPLQQEAPSLALECTMQPSYWRHASLIRRNSASAASSSLIVDTGLGLIETSFLRRGASDASDVGLGRLLDVSKADFVSLRGAGRAALLALRAALDLRDLGDAFGDALREFFRTAGPADELVGMAGTAGSGDGGGVAALVESEAAGLGGAPSSENSDEVGEEGMSLSLSWPFWIAHARRVACACDDCRCSISGVTLRL